MSISHLRVALASTNTTMTSLLTLFLAAFLAVDMTQAVFDYGYDGHGEAQQHEYQVQDQGHHYAEDDYHGHSYEEEKEEHHEPVHYTFEYKVDDPHTGDYKSQHETRHGDKVTGYYMLKEADGTTREVHYTSDKHEGFQAHVSKSGKPHEPAEDDYQHVGYHVAESDHYQ